MSTEQDILSSIENVTSRIEDQRVKLAALLDERDELIREARFTHKITYWALGNAARLSRSQLDLITRRVRRYGQTAK